MNPVGNANIESRSTSLAAEHIADLRTKPRILAASQRSFFCHGNSTCSRPTVQEMILHNSTMSRDQKVRMKKEIKAEKRLVHCGSSVVSFVLFFVFLFFFFS